MASYPCRPTPDHDNEDEEGNEDDDPDDGTDQPEGDTSHAWAPIWLVAHRPSNIMKRCFFA